MSCAGNMLNMGSITMPSSGQWMTSTPDWDVLSTTSSQTFGPPVPPSAHTILTTEQFMGEQWTITVNKDLSLNDRVYMFADPKFIGKSYVLEDMTMTPGLIRPPVKENPDFVPLTEVEKAFLRSDGIDPDAFEMQQRYPEYRMEFFAYETVGSAVGHTAGLARVDFT